LQIFITAETIVIVTDTDDVAVGVTDSSLLFY